MFSTFKRLVGIVSAEERGRNIILEGIPTDVFLGDIARHWSTSKVEKNMLTRTTRSGIVFNKFFAVDILYIVRSLMNEKRTRTPRRILDRIEEELLANTWLKTLETPGPKRLDTSRLSSLKVKLLDTQQEFLQTYDEIVPRYNLNGLLLDAARGSGKTIGSLAWAHCLIENEVTVCVVPSNALGLVWLPTLVDVGFAKSDEIWDSVSGSTPVEGYRYYVVHYDALGKFLPLIPWLSTKKVSIILDESHNMNNETSDRTGYFTKLCKDTGSRNILWMSGTPLKQLGRECIPLLNTIVIDFDEDASGRFRKIYGKDAKRALDILANRIGLLKYTVPKSRVFEINVTPTVVPVKIADSERYTLVELRREMSAFIDERLKFYLKGMREYERRYLEILEIFERSLKSDRDRRDFIIYRRYVNTIRSGYDAASMKLEATYCNQYERKVIIPALPDSLKKEFRSLKSIYKYVELKVMGEALGGVLSRRRIECHMEMAKVIDFPAYIDPSEKKTLIFSSYVEVVDLVNGMLAEGGYKPLLVHAATNKNLNAIVTQFTTDPDANPLTATFQSLSTAVPLTMANTVLLLNSPFRDVEKEQAIGRVDRLGQDAPVHAFEFLLDTGTTPNISTRSKDILEWSKEQVEQILGVKGVELDTAFESLVDEHYLNESAMVISTEAAALDAVMAEIDYIYNFHMGD